jgi:hypothetical protein
MLSTFGCNTVWNIGNNFHWNLCSTSHHYIIRPSRALCVCHSFPRKENITTPITGSWMHDAVIKVSTFAGERQMAALFIVSICLYVIWSRPCSVLKKFSLRLKSTMEINSDQIVRNDGNNNVSSPKKGASRRLLLCPLYQTVFPELLKLTACIFNKIVIQKRSSWTIV